jgi:hypothetical protein
MDERGHDLEKAVAYIDKILEEKEPYFQIVYFKMDRVLQYCGTGMYREDPWHRLHPSIVKYVNLLVGYFYLRHLQDYNLIGPNDIIVEGWKEFMILYCIHKKNELLSVPSWFDIIASYIF